MIREENPVGPITQRTQTELLSVAADDGLSVPLRQTLRARTVGAAPQHQGRRSQTGHRLLMGHTKADSET